MSDLIVAFSDIVGVFAAVSFQLLAVKKCMEVRQRHVVQFLCFALPGFQKTTNRRQRFEHAEPVFKTRVYKRAVCSACACSGNKVNNKIN